MTSRISEKISISLNPLLCERAREEAASRKVALSWLIARALEFYLENASEILQKRVKHLEFRLDQLEKRAKSQKPAADSASALGRRIITPEKNVRAYKGTADVGFIVRAAQKRMRTSKS